MSIFDEARTWADHDPVAADAAEIRTLIDARDEAALRERFHGPLEFGTAGLRGVIGAGESRMNVATVTRATAGLMAWLPDGARVVVGCDARHRSREMFEAACEVISAAGGTALALPPAQPTPLTAFSTRHLGADAGIMITASHNPPQDNGYKVYVAGTQIIPPADAEIAAAIAAAPPADAVPRDRARIEAVDTREDYLAALPAGPASAPTDLNIVLTPMHGVGGELAATALARAGFENVTLVSEQAKPDPDFPTVTFPNPEEPGALDCAIAAASNGDGADLIIALDPDADRCALAVPTANGWRALSGDETGALLGDHLARHGARGTLANSIVSGSLLGEIAEHYGLQFTQTLTGFKWIARAPEIAFGYEEAIGYCCDPAHVTDKDGISAAVTAARLAAELKAAGQTLPDRLDELARRHGLHQTMPLTLRFSDSAQVVDALRRFMSHPPSELGGATVTETSDLSEGYRGLPPTPGLLLRTQRHDRVVVRPSGTEPKLKCYLEVVLPVGEGPVPWEDAHARLEAIKEELHALL